MRIFIRWVGRSWTATLLKERVTNVRHCVFTTSQKYKRGRWSRTTVTCKTCVQVTVVRTPCHKRTRASAETGTLWVTGKQGETSLPLGSQDPRTLFWPREPPMLTVLRAETEGVRFAGEGPSDHHTSMDASRMAFCTLKCLQSFSSCAYAASSGRFCMMKSDLHSVRHWLPETEGQEPRVVQRCSRRSRSV